MNKKGYTFAEIMIVVTIIGVVASVAPVFFTSVYEFFSISTTKLNIQKDARGVLDIINRNLRQASADSIVIDRASTDQPPYSRITFTKQGDTDSMCFYQEDNKIKMSLGGYTGKMLSDNIRYLAFSFPRSDDMGIISVSLTVEKKAAAERTKAIHVAIEKVRIMND